MFSPTQVQVQLAGPLAPRSAPSRRRGCTVAQAAGPRSSQGEAAAGPPGWLRPLALGAAGLALSLQACLSPANAVALELPTPGGAEPEELRIAERLPPLPTQFPPLPPLAMRAHQELRLPNGLKVFLMEDPEVPLVRGTLLMRGGMRAAPPDKVGLATISAGVQRAGGSAAHPGSVLDELLEDRGAVIEGGAAESAISMGFQCLAEDAREVLGLFSEVVQQPALPEAKVDLYKSQVLNYIEHMNDSPRSIPPRELARLIYGPGSVYARQPTAQQVAGIGVADVQQFLAAWERPDSAVMGIVGDFDSREMAGWVRECFGGWRPAAGQPAQPLPVPTPPVPDQTAIAGKLFLVDIPGAAQTSIALGEVGIQLRDQDEFPLDVLTDVLNGFGGRLFDQIRSREGLAYSVQGGWVNTPVDHPGLFLATAETAAPGQLLLALQQALQDATQTAPGAEEVGRAKQESLNSFVFNFSSSTAQLQRLVSYSLQGIPRDYLFQYQRGIEAVTPDQVLAAALRRLHPARQTVVVAGDASRVRLELERLGWQIEPLQIEGAGVKM